MFDPSVGKILWRRAWQPTPVFLPGKSHGQRSLASHKEVHKVAKSCTQRYMEKRRGRRELEVTQMRSGGINSGENLVPWIKWRKWARILKNSNLKFD